MSESAAAEQMNEADADDHIALRAVPDLAGLQVDDASGLRAGQLYGALAEADTGLLRYLDLSLDALDRHVLVPMGHARVREEPPDDPCVRLRAALLEDLEQIPPFPAELGHITDPFERELLEAYGRTFHGERYYAHPAYDHRGLYAGEHPIVGDEAPAGPLTRLSYMPGWRVASGEVDIRRWPLELLDGEHMRVEDLIVDPAAATARYIVVGVREGAGARIVPVGYLQVDRDAGVVRARALTADDVLALPPYDGGGVSRELEDAVASQLRRRLGGRRRYQMPDFAG